MQEMTMVERVARAIDPMSAKVADMLLEKGLKHKDVLAILPMGKARAAIEAIRDPSEKLMENADLDNDKSHAPYCTDWSYFRMQINAMIDAALSE